MTSNTPFDDRRQHGDRRHSFTAMPERFSRRDSDRRLQPGFSLTPWWLMVDYHEELALVPIDETDISDSVRQLRQS